jgi:hypothetical protein
MTRHFMANKDRRRNLRSNTLRGDRNFGKRLGMWCAGALLVMLLLATNLYFRSHPGSAEDVSLGALHDAYARVVPGETTAPELAGMGFDTANGGVRRLSYLGLMEYYAPRDSGSFDDMDPAAQKCLERQDRCSAYVFRLARALGSETQASFGFVNAAEASNPQATVEVVFLIQDGRVAYKAMSGV